MRGIRAWILRLLLRDQLADLEREIEEEFRFHIDMKAAALEAQGLDPKRARAMAEECFGDTQALIRDGLWDLGGIRRTEMRRASMEWIFQDLRDGIRRLLRNPGYSALASGTLALGLAASTAVFTYVNAYYQPFPGADVEEVYQVFQSSDAVPYGSISYPDFLDLDEAGGDQMEVVASGQPLFAASVRHEGLTEVVFGQGVTGNFYPALRVEMSAGRGLLPDDDRPGAPPAVVLSHAYWVRRYGGDEGALGQTILLNNRPHTIVGVAGPDFLGSISAFRPQLWMPFEPFKTVYWARSDNEENREVGVVSPYLRLPPGFGREAAQELLDALAASLDSEMPLQDRSRRFILEPATWIQPQVRRAEGPTARIMLYAGAGLLLLACANMANLVLSAGARRSPEVALRSAMGASRWRLLRQLMTENLLLAGVAGVLALALAGPAAGRLSSYFARPSVWGATVPREISIDPRVLAFAILCALVTGVVTGLVPALRISDRNPAEALKSEGRWSSAGRPKRWRRMPETRDLLVSAQVALSVVLLFVAGLVLRTLEKASEVDPGFNTSWTLASYISTSSMGVPVAERHGFYQELARHFETLPWVQAATVAEQAPLSAHPSGDLRTDGLEGTIPSTVARVFPGYMEAMEMSLIGGRPFARTDSAGAPGVVIVNETLALRMAENGDAIGSTLWLPEGPDGPEKPYEVVGVVRNARQTSLLSDPEPVAYFSYLQHYSPPGNAFLLRFSGSPVAATRRMEEELHRVDARIAIVNILPYSEVVDGFLYTQRMNAELFTLIAALGLLLAVAGVFGVASLAVAHRRREIGIRLAIGASAGEVVRASVSRIGTALLLGVGAGLAGALAVTRLVENLVWGVASSDPVALACGVTVLIGAVALAVSVPIRRALRIDPAGSLRVD